MDGDFWCLIYKETMYLHKLPGYEARVRGSATVWSFEQTNIARKCICSNDDTHWELISNHYKGGVPNVVGNSLASAIVFRAAVTYPCYHIWHALGSFHVHPYHMDGSYLMGVPPVLIYFQRILHYKPSSELGVAPWLWKPSSTGRPPPQLLEQDAQHDGRLPPRFQCSEHLEREKIKQRTQMAG